MNLNNMALLLGEVAATPNVTLLDHAAARGSKALLLIAAELIMAEIRPEDDPMPPSVASWLGLAYEPMMSLFHMQPVDQPQCSRLGLTRASMQKCRAFDALPDALRNAILCDLLAEAIATGRVCWYTAQARNNIECAA